MRVFGKKQNRTSSTTVFTGLGHRLLFPLPKTEGKKGKLFATIEEIKEKSKQALLAISKITFQKCFEDCKKCWSKRVIQEGVYFEGDKIVSY